MTAIAMFGGHGLYRGRTFFGIISKGRLYFRTNGATRPVYLERGMKAFRPKPEQTLKNYFEVPVEIIDEPDRLVDWAQDAIQCSGRTTLDQYKFNEQAKQEI